MALGLLHSLLLYHTGAISLGDVVAYNGVLMFLQFPTFATQFAYPQVSSGPGQRAAHPGVDERGNFAR
ncbi:MAG: hypothetical protein KatS3mg052_1007 [Candidatus Roseilinea sp.]|nr:MAG: hypothetical protein KatS3mg052_1007 [Candidatus Roseilinea sp.]